MRYLLALLLLFLPIVSSYATDSLKDQSQSYREEGYKLQTLGNCKEALSYYRKAAQLTPTDARIYNDLGVIYENLGNDNLAIDMYKRAIELDGQYLPVYTNLAKFYEQRNNIEKANYYWQKRYELGQVGDPWREVAKEKLLAAGIYTDLQREKVEVEAAQLSKEVGLKRKVDREKVIEKAKAKFDIARGFFMKSQYPQALEELKQGVALNPENLELRKQMQELYVKIEKLYIKEQLTGYVQEALVYIKNDKYNQAGEQLQKAEQAVVRISQNQ